MSDAVPATVTWAVSRSTVTVYSVVAVAKSSTLVPSTVSALRSASALPAFADASALHGPSPASFPARTRTVCSMPLVRPVISWVVASAAAVADCPAVPASAQVWAAVFHSTS